MLGRLGSSEPRVAATAEAGSGGGWEGGGGEGGDEGGGGEGGCDEGGGGNGCDGGGFDGGGEGGGGDGGGGSGEGASGGGGEGGGGGGGGEGGGGEGGDEGGGGEGGGEGGGGEGGDEGSAGGEGGGEGSSGRAYGVVVTFLPRKGGALPRGSRRDAHLYLPLEYVCLSLCSSPFAVSHRVGVVSYQERVKSEDSWRRKELKKRYMLMCGPGT